MGNFDELLRRVQPQLEKGEDFSVKFFHRARDVLPIIARVLLLSSYLDDCFRIIFHYDERMRHSSVAYGFSPGVSHVYWISVLIIEFIGAGLILSRKRVPTACCMLLLVLTFQFIMMLTRYFYFKTFFRILAQYGAILMCWAEWEVAAEKRQNSTAFSTMLPALDGGIRKPQTLMQLAGRLLIVLMFINVLELDVEDLGFWSLLWDIVAVLLALCVAIGYRTRLAALSLIVMLLIFNLTHYAFYLLPSEVSVYVYEVTKRSFFLVFNVIGGLLLIVTLGAGAASLDQRRSKKGL